jgi:hypothetical protein
MELGRNERVTVGEALNILIDNPKSAADRCRTKAELLDKLWFELGQPSGASWEEFIDTIRDGSLVKELAGLGEGCEILNGFLKSMVETVFPKNTTQDVACWMRNGSLVKWIAERQRG